MECPDHLQGSLRDRLLEVAARRAHRAADGQRADLSVVKFDGPGSLVEGGNAAFQVGRERLLAGDLLQPAGELPHRLRPARCAVGQQQHVQAHLPVVLAQRRGRVDRRLAGGNRHGRRVGDDDRPLHQAAAGSRVGQFREVAQRFHDLARPLAAGRDHHDVDFRVAGGDLLQDRLARPERAGDAIRPAADDRETSSR